MRTHETRLEWATPEAKNDLLGLEEELRRVALAWLGRARGLSAPAEECADQPGEPLEGCVKIRFGLGDEPWLTQRNPARGPDPQWRMVLEYLPEDRPERLLVWSIGLGHPPRGRRVPSAYALAGRRRSRRLTEDPGYRKEAQR